MHDVVHDHHHEPLEENMLWIMDHIELKSVGIDVGSAGTQVIFSLLKLRRMGEDLTSRYVVVSRESLYRSPVELTPYLDETKIDDRALGEIIDTAYEMAGFKPGEIDTGAVILTGEAMRRHNARAIADLLAHKGGEFVCAAAGHNMESTLAAFGSGAALRSYEQGCRILNIDIGGGTTKLAVVENGKVTETAALYVGGRLLVVDGNERLVRLDAGGEHIASLLGLSWQAGDVISNQEVERMASWMGYAIVAAVTEGPLPTEVESLFLTPPLKQIGEIDGVMFSGGVGEYVYNREPRYFGDLGKPLGESLRRNMEAGAFPWPLFSAGECIRATVVGASEYSVQVSGNTVYISDSALLPRKNLQVLRPAYELRGEIDPERLAESIDGHFHSFDLVEGEVDVALAFHWEGEPSYERIAAFALGVERGLKTAVRHEKPLFLVVDGDIARTVGSILKEERKLKSDVLSIDGILLRDFDFIDVGRMLYPSGTVPVTIKSLVFQL